jgi:hypothetical protein
MLAANLEEMNTTARLRLYVPVAVVVAIAALLLHREDTLAWTAGASLAAGAVLSFYGRSLALRAGILFFVSHAALMLFGMSRAEATRLDVYLLTGAVLTCIFLLAVRGRRSRSV